MRMNSGIGPVTIDSTKAIGRGGEATVYSVKGHRDIVAKVYHQPTRERADKLRTMVGNAPADPGRSHGHVSIAWPKALLSDNSGKVVGYLMPAIRDSFPFLDVYHPAARRQSLPKGFGYQYLLRTASNICSAAAAVHAMGYVIGDLNECNILVQADARITFIDCDSFQVGTHRCVVGRPEYSAPELQGAELSTVDRTPEQDCFALAVLLHQLLMAGVHPYAGVGEPGSLHERIQAGLCPYVPGGKPPPRNAPGLEWLPPPLQKLFTGAFVRGHEWPAARPSAMEWAARLIEAEKALVGCPRDNSHPHFNHLPKCPACHSQISQHRRRKPQPSPMPRMPSQQPLPGLRTGTKGMASPRWALPAVLMAITMISYHWPTLKNVGEQLPVTAQATRHAQDVDQATMFARPDAIRVAEGPRRLESGSEIYQALIGHTPYREPDAVGYTPPDVERGDSDAQGSYPRPVSPKEGPETGSEIYASIIGKDPY